MVQIILFTDEDGNRFPHIENVTGGSHDTACGDAFDAAINSDPIFTSNGSPTCEKCIGVIRANLKVAKQFKIKL